MSPFELFTLLVYAPKGFIHIVVLFSSLLSTLLVCFKLRRLRYAGLVFAAILVSWSVAIGICNYLVSGKFEVTPDKGLYVAFLYSDFIAPTVIVAVFATGRWLSRDVKFWSLFLGLIGNASVSLWAGRFFIIEEGVDAAEVYPISLCSLAYLPVIACTSLALLGVPVQVRIAMVTSATAPIFLYFLTNSFTVGKSFAPMVLSIIVLLSIFAINFFLQPPPSKRPSKKRPSSLKEFTETV